MTTLLLHKNRLLRAVALLCGIALIIGVKSSVSPRAAGSLPTSVVFRAIASCGGGNFTVSANGNALATFAAPTSCTCSESVKEVTITDPAKLAFIGAPGCTDYTLSNPNGIYLSWAKVIVNRLDGAETTCISDGSGGCATENPNFCSGYLWSTSWGPGPRPDNDSDGQNNCVDADMDNDGVANATDNCSLISNAAQTDSDSNGFGDTCDPVDIDGDGIWNSSDNCPAIANVAQTDTDGNGVGDACQPSVVAVPWLGSEALQHQVYSGGQLILQAVASNPADGSAVSLASGTWDAGDGAGPQPINVSNSLALELAHTYIGADGQPFTATIRVVDSGGAVYTDTFKVVIKPNVRETKVNMAIDKGLWYLHKRMNRTVSDGKPSAYWVGYNPPAHTPAATASTVQSFEINNHRESGDPSKDPYATDARLGLRYLLSLQHGYLQRMNVPLQNGNNPDANGNGYGLVVSPGDHSSYITGQVMDAIVASGTPNKTADTGQATYVAGRTYKDIVQDMLDGYSWGMADNTGGWHYTYADTSGGNDTSASHWWGIGVLAAENWGLDAPAWVKNIQKTAGLSLMQAYPGDCHFGYTNSTGAIWDDATNVTAAGLILMNADDLDKANPRFTCAEAYLAARFNASTGNFYTMYQTTKAMRTALDGTGTTSSITMLNGTIDWYAAYADWLISRQNALGTGKMDGNVGTASSYIVEDMATSWAVIMLSPTLFENGPTAVCSVDSTFVCSSGATCGAATAGVYSTANFDGSQSTAGDNPIASYAWNFQDTTTATGATASHSFSTIGTFPVQLTVADTKGNSSSVTCAVTVTDTALPPVADTGGPYEICLNRSGSVILDASGSFGRGANIESYAWDYTAPVNLSAIDSTAVSVDATAYFLGLGPGTYDIALRINDDSASDFTTTAYSTVTVRTGNDPRCNANPVATDNAYTMAKNTTLSGNAVTDGTADSDADGDTFTAAMVAGPAQGTLVLNADGTFTYAPPAGFDGVVTFTYKLTDQFNGESNVATVTITVIPNSPPVAVDDSASTFSGTPVTVSVLTNDGDPDFDLLTLTAVTQGTNGSVTDNGDGTVTYSPNAGFADTDTFTYSISDGHGGTASATVTVTVVKRTATVTADSGTKVYGSGDPALGATESGFQVADGIAVSYTGRDGGESVGNYATHATASGAALVNYDVTYVDGSFSITQATAVATATGGTATYDGQSHEGTCTVAGVNGEVLTGTISYSSGAAPVAQGSYTVTCTFAGDQNYGPASGTATITINPAALTVVANDQTRSYLAPDPALDGTLTGVVTGDGITATYSSTGTGSQVPGAYPIVPALVDPDAKLGNYSVTSVNGTLTITNTAPVCSAATPSKSLLWPPNHKWTPITINGVTDVDGGPIAIQIVSIFQDEPTDTRGDGETSIDGRGIGTNTAWVRAERIGDRDDDSDHHERDGCDHERGKKGHKKGDNCDHERDERNKARGDGRVYHITFTATDSLGLSCTGEVTVGVPHDRGQHATPIDGGALYDSTKPTLPVGHSKGDGCEDGDHEKGRKGSEERHFEGDKCDHEAGKNGHKKNDGCEHERHKR